jgi:serine/threonine protein kinase
VPAVSWRLPGYVIEALLGTGGSGDVWQARVATTGEPVALKRIQIRDRRQLRAARVEAVLLSVLDHPNLVRLHEFLQLRDAGVLVLDLATGGSLASMLERRGRLCAGEVVSTLAPIGAALAYAHRRGVVHADVSAANVLFAATGQPLLSDLGMARIIGDRATRRTTAAYVDPSVAAGYVSGPPSDVFSLAAVAVHALTGRPIWDGATSEELIANAASGQLGDLRSRLAGVPETLVGVLEYALAIQPDRRCTAAEFALDLRHTVQPVPVELRAGRLGTANAQRWAPARSGAAGGDASVRPRARGQHRQRAAHRADGASARPVQVAAHGGGAGNGGDGSGGADRNRPDFPRPQPLPPLQLPGPDITHPLRPPPRPTLPSRRMRAARRRRHLVPLGIAVVLAVAVGAAVVTRSHWRSTTPSDIRPPAVSSVSAAAPQPPPAAIASALARLDSVRERAFAERRPNLLAAVYPPGPLLAQDTALVTRMARSGCGLRGMHTTYSDVKPAVSTKAGSLTVTARALLAPSTLVCHSRLAGRAAGAGPATLRIGLVRKGADYLIARQDLLG